VKWKVDKTSAVEREREKRLERKRRAREQRKQILLPVSSLQVSHKKKSNNTSNRSEPKKSDPHSSSWLASEEERERLARIHDAKVEQIQKRNEENFEKLMQFLKDFEQERKEEQKSKKKKKKKKKKRYRRRRELESLESQHFSEEEEEEEDIHQSTSFFFTEESISNSSYADKSSLFDIRSGSFENEDLDDDYSCFATSEIEEQIQELRSVSFNANDDLLLVALVSADFDTKTAERLLMDPRSLASLDVHLSELQALKK